jgi:Outer membrane protein beta-barrel domain
MNNSVNQLLSLSCKGKKRLWKVFYKSFMKPNPPCSPILKYLVIKLYMGKHWWCLILLFSSPCIGQTKFGIKGGLNQARFYHRPQYDGDSKYPGKLLTRFNAGLHIEIPLDGENWFLYTGSFYNGKGNRIKLSHQSFDTIVTKLNYIELPISVGYKFQSGQNNKIITGAGVYGAYGFGGKKIFHNDTRSSRQNLHRKDSAYKRIDFGLSLSTGYEFNEKCGIRLEYSRSLFDISRRDWKETNNVFSFSFFWYIPKSKLQKMKLSSSE